MTAYTTDISVSLTDLYTFTGSTADVNELNRTMSHAISAIETISGVFFEADFREVSISTTDAAWLKRAAIYQAVFMIEQGDVLSRTAVSNLSQDGLSVSAPDGLTFVLAPMARRALGNCSWAKSGTLKVAPPAEVSPSDDFLVSDAHAWAPLGAV